MGGRANPVIDCNGCKHPLGCPGGCERLARMAPPPPKAHLRYGWICGNCQTVHCPDTMYCDCLRQPSDERDHTDLPQPNVWRQAT